jgi:hypothetical protein
MIKAVPTSLVLISYRNSLLFTDLLSIVRFDSAIFVVAEENTRLQSKLG